MKKFVLSTIVATMFLSTLSLHGMPGREGAESLETVLNRIDPSRLNGDPNRTEEYDVSLNEIGEDALYQKIEAAHETLSATGINLPSEFKFLLQEQQRTYRRGLGEFLRNSEIDKLLKQERNLEEPIAHAKRLQSLDRLSAKGMSHRRPKNPNITLIPGLTRSIFGNRHSVTSKLAEEVSRRYVILLMLVDFLKPGRGDNDALVEAWEKKKLFANEREPGKCRKLAELAGRAPGYLRRQAGQKAFSILCIGAVPILYLALRCF